MMKKISAPVLSKSNKNKKKNVVDNSKSNTGRNYITVPYTKGLSESIKNVQETWHTSLLQRGQDYERPPGSTQRQRPITKKSGIIYRYKCDRLECNEKYIGQSTRTLGERFREHLKAPSPIYDHCNTIGHNTAL